MVWPAIGRSDHWKFKFSMKHWKNFSIFEDFLGDQKAKFSKFSKLFTQVVTRHFYGSFHVMNIWRILVLAENRQKWPFLGQILTKIAQIFVKNNQFIFSTKFLYHFNR